MATAKKTNFSTILSGCLALAAFGVYSLGEWVNDENLAKQPVKAVPTKQGSKDGVTPFDVRSLFPVWVASASKVRHADDDSSVDELFKENKPVPVNVLATPPEPDYAALLSSRMRVDGIGEGGAFINGKFYHVGESIFDFEYPAAGRQIVPRLAEVREKSVVVAHGKNKTEIKL